MLPTGGPYYVLRVVCVVGPLSLWIFLALNIEKTDFSLFVPRVRIETQQWSSNGTNLTNFAGFLVYTPGCRIPDLDPLDPSVAKYITAPTPLDCKQIYGIDPFVTSDLHSLRVDRSMGLAHNLSCSYTPFWRETAPLSESSSSGVDLRVKFAEKPVKFDVEVDVTDEFVQVDCVSDNGTTYRDYHAFVPLKNISDSRRKAEKEKAVSVLMVGVDAVSRLNFYRQMPQTLKFLKNNLGAVEMLGYNKVGDNTFPNLVPVLTGLSENELTKSCWPSSKSLFDDCPFIWKNYSAAGYTTGFGEDASWMGIFSYLKRGFREKPTDYYFRPFNVVSEEDIGSEKRLNAKLCMGPRKVLESLLSYASKFSITLKNFLSFGFFWGASLTHDYLNLPKLGDLDHKVFLEDLYNRGVFESTVLVFMSDHGIRWGEIRKTYQGFLEERLPFLYIAYPEWFRTGYTTAVSNLRKNARRLTTPFDLHEMLLDLTDLSRIDQDLLKKRSDELLDSSSIPRGISLFLPVPEGRTCALAGIDDHWCTCHVGVNVPVVNSSEVLQSAAAVVKHVNWQLRHYPQCARLYLNTTITAREERSPTDETFSDLGMKDLSLTIETTPGGALFEATVRHNLALDTYSLVGTVSRINLYGDQSKCVPQYRLRLYCYCLN